MTNQSIEQVDQAKIMASVNDNPESHLDQLKKDIHSLKQENDVLHIKETDLEKNKAIYSKEQIESIKKEIENKIKELEEKKSEMIKTIEDLVKLKKEVKDQESSTALDEYKKELMAIEIKKPSRWVGAREKTKHRVGDNKKTLLIGWALVGGFLLLRSLFKKKKKDKEKGTAEKEKEWFWSSGIGKTLKWIGAATGLTWLGRGLFTGKRDFFGWNPFGKEDPTKPPETMPWGDVNAARESYLALDENTKKPYENLATQVNAYYGNVLQDQWGISHVEDMLGDSDFEKKDGKQLNGLVPYMLAGRYKTIDNMLSTRAFYYEIVSTEGHIAWDKFSNRSVDQIKAFFIPLAWMVDSIGGALIKLNTTGVVSDFFDSIKTDSNMEKILRTVFRKSISVMSYMESRRRMVEYNLAYTLLKQKNEDGFDTMSEEDQQEKVIDMLDDDEWYTKNIAPEVKTFMDKNLVEAISYLEKNNMLNGEIDEPIKQVVEQVEERRKSLLGIDDEDDESDLVQIKQSITQGKLSPEAKEKLQELCKSFEDDIDGFWRKSWYNQYLPILELLNVDEDTLQRMQSTGDYDGVVKIYRDYTQSILKKSDEGSLIPQDIDGLEEHINDYYKFQKSLVVTQFNMSEARDKNGDVIVTRTNSVIRHGEELKKGVQMTIKWDVREKIKWGAKIAGAVIWLDLLTYPVRLVWTWVNSGRVAHSPTVKALWHIGKFTFRSTIQWIDMITGRAIRAHLPYGFWARRYTEAELKYAIVKGEIDIEKAVKIANKKWWRLIPDNSNSRIINSPDDVLRRFLPWAKDELYVKTAKLLKTYRHNPHICKEIFDQTYENRKIYRPKDWLKLDKTKMQFSFNESNLLKLEKIDHHISHLTNPTEKKIFESMMRYTKKLDIAEDMVTMGIESQYIHLFEKGPSQLISAEKFWLYLGKYTKKLLPGDMLEFQKFLDKAKKTDGMIKNPTSFVRNSIKNFAELKKHKFDLIQVEKLGLNSNRWAKIAEVTKTNTSKMVASLESMAKNPRFKPFWSGIKNQINALNEYKKTITPQGIKALKEMSRLDSMTGFWSLSNEGIQAMSKISYALRDVEVWPKLITALREAKTLDKVKEILTTEGISSKSIPDEILNKIANTKSAKSIEGIVNYGAEIKAVQGFRKLISNPAVKYGTKILGKALVGLDVVMVGSTFIDQYGEAQKIKQNNLDRGERKEDQAYFEVTTWWLWAIAGACMFIPGAWWIAWWALFVVMWIQEMGKKYYDDINLFKKNYSEFMQDGMVSIKQDIVNINIWDQGIDRTWIDKMAMFKNMRWAPSLGILWAVGQNSISEKDKWVKSTTTDAIRALLYLDEMEKYPLSKVDSNRQDVRDDAKTLEQVLEAKKQVDQAVAKRFEYIKKTYIDTKKPIIDKTKYEAAKWMQALDAILQDSSIYQTMMSDETYPDKDLVGYQETRKKRLQEKDPQAFQKCENIFAKNNRQMYLMFAQLPYYQNLANETLSADPDIQSIQENIRFIQEYMAYKMLGVSIHTIPQTDINPEKIDYTTIDVFVRTFSLQASFMEEQEIEQRSECLTQEQVTNRFGMSPYIGQNILFEIAKKLDYSWPNTWENLHQWFAPDNGEKYGIYYEDDTRYLNENWWLDTTIGTDQDMQNMSTILTMRGYIQNAKDWIVTGDMVNSNEKINTEYANNFMSIINKEIDIVRAKEKYKQQLTVYVHTHATGWKYVKIPEDMLLLATRSGIQDIAAFVYTSDTKNILGKSTIAWKKFTGR